MRIEYKLTPEEKEELLKAMQPVALIALQCGMPSSRQENANRAWKALGLKRGFDGFTVRPVPGKSDDYFTAEQV